LAPEADGLARFGGQVLSAENLTLAHTSLLRNTERDYRPPTRCAKGRHKLHTSQGMLGAGLSWRVCGKVPPYMPALRPYRGKTLVRNDRGPRKRRHHTKPGPRPRSYPTAGGGYLPPYRDRRAPQQASPAATGLRRPSMTLQPFRQPHSRLGSGSIRTGQQSWSHPGCQGRCKRPSLVPPHSSRYCRW